VQTDSIIFGCPTYMGSRSAEMKRFLEAAAKKWFTHVDDRGAQPFGGGRHGIGEGIQ
jgi:multimeric flavodoxin WrbA